MAAATLLWEDHFEESFDLIAIHCSEEAFKMAYLLNQFTGMKLRRCKQDLDLVHEGTVIDFPIFLYEDFTHHTNYYLIQNKSAPINDVETEASRDSLFYNDHLFYYLLPQYKKVEFFLKIVHENQQFPIKDFINWIKEIRQVVSVYALDVSLLKSKDNLIFDLC